MNNADVERLTAMLGGGDDVVPEIRTDPARVVQAMRDGFAVLQVIHELATGQVVRCKPGVEDGYKAPNGGVLLFVRDFTEEDRDNNQRAVDNMHVSNDKAFLFRSRDCVVLRLLDDGGVLELPATKRCLEPHPDFVD